MDRIVIDRIGTAPPADSTLDPAPAISGVAILCAVFVIGASGLLYELLASTLASYVLGDSITQFSTIIGVYLFAMGVGSWLSRFVGPKLIVRFIEIEIAIALIGGASSAILFLSFGRVEFFRLILYSLVGLIGTLVGLEIPLLMRILKNHYALKDLLSRVLTVDYLGALLASLAFPMFIVPKFGLVRGAFAAGIVNGIVAYASTHILENALKRRRTLWFLRVETVLCLVLLAAGFVWSDELTSLAEDAYYTDPVVFSKTTPYQRMVVTRGQTGYQLYLNGHLQFSSADEHRYHEALVHPPMAVVEDLGGRGATRVLVLGGGDGLAVREVLRHPGVREVSVVDLDPDMTRTAREHPVFRAQNQDAFRDGRVHIVNDDAMVWLRKVVDRRPEDGQSGGWDVVIADFPDPNSYGLGKLYTTAFYRLVKASLAPNGALVVQATSPLMARRSFWCIVQTLEASGFFVRPYQAAVPSFGIWGFALAANRPFGVPTRLPLLRARSSSTRSSGESWGFLNDATLEAMFVFPDDMSRVRAEVNRLNHQVLVQYYEEEWAPWQ